MATGYLIVKVVPQLRDFDLLMTLTDKFKEQVWIVALTMQQIMLELVDDLLSLAKFVKKVNVLFLLSLVHF
jgi:selenocysteine lyase/cysteine desulfurase